MSACWVFGGFRISSNGLIRESMTVKWPGNRAFAFTIFDDPDAQTLSGLRIVYDFLSNADLRTTVGVWPCRPVRERNSYGATCANIEYRKYVQDLSRSGFEIGYHNTTPHSSFRAEIADGLDKFSEFFGEATQQRFPAGRERALPSIETRSGAPEPKTAYRVAPVLAGDVCASRRQVVDGERGFLASACGGYERCKVQPRTKLKKIEHGGKVIADRIVGRSDVVDFKARQNCDEEQIADHVRLTFLGGAYFRVAPGKRSTEIASSSDDRRRRAG